MHSMTGFGRGTHATDQWAATVEIASVNRKQAEIVVQAARELSELESEVRKVVLQHISRGRLQVSLHLEAVQATATTSRVDAGLAQAFEQAFVDLSRLVGRELSPAPSDYLRQTGLITFGGAAIDAASAWDAIRPALQTAIEQLTAMRAREGSDLKTDFLERLTTLESFVVRISGLAPARPERQKELLLKRLRDTGLDFDPSDERVLRELALFADRCDISEELLRLDSHFAKFREYLDSSEPAGRPLDFLCQEVFREFNTIGSKANDAVIAQTIVEAKTELEKIREQVQNVE